MANEVKITVTSRDKSGPGMKSARQNADELGNSTRRVGEIAAGILASQVFERIAQAAIRAFTDTIRAASDLNESVNAVQVVFGNAADEVMAIGENSATSMGLSQRAFNEAAVRFSAFARTIAGDGGDVAGVVERVTQRSSDFASVMNIDVAQAMQLFQSGLAGESEPLRRYGIDISAAATNTFAWANGIAEAGQELSEAQKVQARYGLIMEQTSATQGDFANTSDDMANAQRILNAEIEDLQAQMGSALLPVLGELFSFLTDVVTGFGELPGSVQATIGVLSALIPIAGAAAAAMRLLGISFQMLKTAAPFIAGALAIGGAIIIGLKALGASSEEAAAEVDGLATAIRNADLAGIARDLEDRGVLAKVEALGLSVEDAVNAFAEGGPAMADFRSQLEGIIEAGTTQEVVHRRMADGGNEVRDVMNAEAEQAAELLGILDELDRGLIGVEEAQRRMAAVTAETASVIDEETAKMAESWSEAIDDITDAADAYSDMLSGLEEDEKASVDAFLEQMERRVKVANEHNANIVTINERASDDVREQMLEDAKENPELAALMVEATEEEWDRMEEAYRDATEAATTASHDAMIRAIPALTAVAEAMGQKMARGIARKLEEGGNLSVTQARKIFNNIDAEFHDDIAATIRPTMDSFSFSRVLGEIGNLTAPRTLWVTPQISGGGTRITGPGFSGAIAHGGIVGSGTEPRGMQGGGPADRRVLVGEHRPEVVELPVGSRVIPSVDQAMDRNQGGGGPVDVRVIFDFEGLGADEAFVEFMKRAFRVRGETLGSAA